MKDNDYRNDDVLVKIKKETFNKVLFNKLCKLFCLTWFISFILITFLGLYNNRLMKLFFQETDNEWINNSSIVLNISKTQKQKTEYVQTKLKNDFRNNAVKKYERATFNDSRDSNENNIYNQVCSAQQNVVFLKTHKTGSSTVTNILNRYADLQELIMLLPAMGDSRFVWPRRFHWSSVDLLRLDGQLANMLVNHARYDRSQMDMMMADKTKYISIIRNPVWQFESSFYYFEIDKLFHLNNYSNAIEKFLIYPDELIYNLTMKLNDLPDDINLLQNGMFYDLGFDFIDAESEEIIEKTLKKLEDEFSLILIMEYFDESLVLLKIEFCWEFDDILYIKQNQRLHKKRILSKNTIERIKSWNRADVKLYDYFNKTFWKKVNKYGERFWDQVKEFKSRNKAFREICSPQQIIMKAHNINVSISSYVMNPKADRYNRYLCEKALTNEMEYLNYFRKKFQMNFGYQRILIAEGLRKLKRNKPLQERMKRMHLKSPKFFLPGEIKRH